MTMTHECCDGGVFRASVPVAWSVAGSGWDEVSGLVASIIERDGSLAASELNEQRLFVSEYRTPFPSVLIRTRTEE